MEAINYRLNGEVMALFHFAPAYKKLEKTYFRLPKEEELGFKTGVRGLNFKSLTFFF